MGNFRCEVCNKTFSRRGNLNVHLTAKHSNVKYECNICDFTTCRKYNLRRHIKLKHEAPKPFVQTTIKCSLCTETRPTKKYIVDHYIVQHEIVIKNETLDFQNEEEFKIWKKKIETEQDCEFCIFRSKYKHKTDATSRMTYACHRDGEFKSKGKNIRPPKKSGSKKINGHCPAKLELIFHPNGGLKVHLCKTHVGHTSDLGHLRLSQTEKDEVVHQIAMNVPFDKVLDHVRFSIGKDLSHTDLLSRNDSCDIEHGYSFNSEAIKYKINAISIESWVREMENAGEIVLFYKPQGVLLEIYPQVHADDFILIVMNESQKEMLKHYGNKFICFDSTHDLNSYGFGLTTLLVLNDLNQGFPCAFMFSNREDLAIIEVFVFALKDAINSAIQTNVFMSNMAKGYYNAWVKTMPPPKFHLFCTWHVDYTWRKNLNKIRGRKKQAETYKLLRILLEERDKETFTCMLPQVIAVMRKDVDTRDFAIYFEKEYKDSAPNWAYCYHLHSGINTSMHLEHMHGILKNICMIGKNLKQLDLVLHALMRFIRVKCNERLIYCSKIVDLHERHRESLKLCIENIVFDKDMWKIQSLNGNEIYEVRQIDQLQCECDLSCAECKICIHAYTCSCPDSSIKFNMCQHIHAVRRKINMSPPEPNDTNQNENLTAEELPMFIIRGAVIKRLQRQSENMEQKKAKIMRHFKSILDEVQSGEQLELINKEIQTLKSTIEACKFKRSLSSESQP